jgi:hypothetical protein
MNFFGRRFQQIDTTAAQDHELDPTSSNGTVSNAPDR